MEAPDFERIEPWKNIDSIGEYPDELSERAVRMVLDHEDEYGSQWEAICSVAERLGPKAETDRGGRSGPTTEQLTELKRFKRENAELGRANDIIEGLLAAAQLDIGVLAVQNRAIDLGAEAHAVLASMGLDTNKAIEVRGDAIPASGDTLRVR